MSGSVTSPLTPLLEASGGIGVAYHDGVLIRDFGDTDREYRAATESAAVFDRSHRTRVRVSGRAPGQMLGGILTGTIPPPPAEVEAGITNGLGTYHAVLTPKGKMISDAWAYLTGDEADPGFLLDIPVAGRHGLLEHLRRFLPPRLARLEDVSATTAMVTVVGPRASEVVSASALGLRVEASVLEGMAEGEWVRAGDQDSVLVVRTDEVWPPAFSVIGRTGDVSALWSGWVGQGVVPAGSTTWSALRVEAGRPVFGTDMTEQTIPNEAGLETRAIDDAKGCYTGQEVIVRIRDRGHVNRHLRLLDLGAGAAVEAGDELFSDDGADKPVGWITSVVESPRAGGVLALGYVRRGVDTVRIAGRTVSPIDLP